MGEVVSLGSRLVVVRDGEAIEVHKQQLRRERYNYKARPRRAEQRAKRLQRIPPWADLAAIRGVYELCAAMSRHTGRPYEVDHIIPLLGERVSGLHVADNLQVIPKRDNRDKRNRYEV